MRANFEAKEVFISLCSSFDYNAAPQGCFAIDPVEPTDQEPEDENKVVLVLIIILCLIVIGAILFAYRAIVKKDINRDMKMQINNAVAQYFQLADMPRD